MNVHEIFHFAGDKNNEQILDFYLNNLPFLKSFTANFRDKMSDFIDHRIPGRLIQLEKPALIKTKDHKAIIPPYSLNNADQSPFTYGVHLTNKERLCLQLLKQGYTNKQMARHFGNSPRTIEELVSNIMRKFKVHSRQDFIPFPVWDLNRISSAAHS